MAQKKTPKTHVRFDTVLCNLAGRPLISEDQGPITLEMVSVGALLANEATLAGREKFSRYILAKRIHEDVELELTSSEVDLLKTVIGNHCTQLVVGRSFDLLDGKAAPVPVNALPEPETSTEVQP